MRDDGDLLIVLRWDRRRAAFDVSLRFDMASNNVEDWLQVEHQLKLDLDELNRLAADEDAYGEALTSMVLRLPEIEPFFARSRARAEGDHRLHLRLHIAAPARFHAIRWESLRDPRTGARLATQADIVLSRYLSSPDWRPIPARMKHDLRALIVVAGPRNLDQYQPEGRGLAPVDVQGELDRARAALADIHFVQELSGGQATLSAVLEAMELSPDILYLVCHGALVDEVPLLVLENADQTADVVDGRRLVERLSELERRPTVVMLSSCQSAGSGDETWSTRDDGALAALGPRLSAVGVAAVVAMQGNISMETANQFAPAFFSALAREGVVDEAMATARRAVAERSDWWVPVLFSRLRSGRTYYRPAFAERQESTWESLRMQLSRAAITPVLGPGLSAGILGDRQQIAQQWVERWQMPLSPRDRSDLPKVAQYLKVRFARGNVSLALQEHLLNVIQERRNRAKADDPVWQLPDEVLQASDPEPAILEIGRRQRQIDGGDPFRAVAAMGVDVFITTGWSDLLQDALRERGLRPVTMSFPWKRQDHSARRISPTRDAPLVYHLYGRLEDPPSLVLSEDDYFLWLSAWINERKSIPPAVQKALTARPLLFLGYRMDDWDFRVIFHGIKSFGGSALLTENLHVGVQLSPDSQSIEPEAAQDYLESYFGNDKVSIYWGETRHFLDELRERGLLS